MINPKQYMQTLLELGVEFCSGFPDSILKEFCSCVTEMLGVNSKDAGPQFLEIRIRPAVENKINLIRL